MAAITSVSFYESKLGEREMDTMQMGSSSNTARKNLLPRQLCEAPDSPPSVARKQFESKVFAKQNNVATKPQFGRHRRAL
jgi:hypothetical protein